jgi:hypothetical protein
MILAIIADHYLIFAILFMQLRGRLQRMVALAGTLRVTVKIRNFAEGEERGEK